MHKSGWIPSIMPNGDDRNVYHVVDGLARRGQIWREADVEITDPETVLLELLEG